MSDVTEGKKEIQIQAKTLGFMIPSSLKEGMEVASLIAKSDMAPKEYKDKPGNVIIAMQMGMEVGLSPMQAIQNIACINGRPSVWGDAMLALCMNHPAFEAIDENESSDKKGVCVVKRRGMESQRREFTVDDAKKAGLWGKQGPWQTAPARMLKLRARAFALRDTFADALRGLQSADEQVDIIDTTAIPMPRRSETTTPPEQVPPPAAAVAAPDPLVEASVFIAEVKKFSDGHFEILDSEGVSYQTTDESIAKTAKDAKGTDRVICFQTVADNMPTLVSVLPAKSST
jgi:hypothetical protein